MMNRHFVLDLGHAERHGHIIGGKLPISDPAYSPLLDVGFNCLSFSWRDEKYHLHKNAEEYFIVLGGSIRFRIENECVTVNQRELIGIRSGIAHQIVGGNPPIKNFLIRVPGGLSDKVILDSFESSTINEGQANNFIHIDLQKPHHDYLLGACLPTTHIHHSYLLDFTCVWGVDPNVEWQRESLHYHNQREEYYFLLNGELDFEIDGSTISLSARQILGVRPGAVHKVAGGKGSVDVLFVRVPGGRGDKVILQQQKKSL